LSCEPLLSRQSLLLSYEPLLLSCEPLLSRQALLLAGQTLLLVGCGLIHDFVGVNSGLHHTLGVMCLCFLHDGNCSLTVDDGLDLVNHVGDHVGLHDSGSLHHTAHVGSRGFLDVLLNVMDDVLVNLTVNNRLHFYDAIIADGFLHHWRNVGSALVNDGLLEVGLGLEGGLVGLEATLL